MSRKGIGGGAAGSNEIPTSIACRISVVRVTCRKHPSVTRVETALARLTGWRAPVRPRAGMYVCVRPAIRVPRSSLTFLLL
eukprot:6632064-Prymnesium_polylepis.1